MEAPTALFSPPWPAPERRSARNLPKPGGSCAGAAVNGGETDKIHWINADEECPGLIRNGLEQHSPPGAAQRSRPPRRHRADAAAAPRAPSCRLSTRKLPRRQTGSLEGLVVLGQGQQQLRQGGCVGLIELSQPLVFLHGEDPPTQRPRRVTFWGSPAKAASSTALKWLLASCNVYWAAMIIQ